MALWDINVFYFDFFRVFIVKFEDVKSTLANDCKFVGK